MGISVQAQAYKKEIQQAQEYADYLKYKYPQELEAWREFMDGFDMRKRMKSAGPARDPASIRSSLASLGGPWN